MQAPANAHCQNFSQPNRNITKGRNTPKRSAGNHPTRNESKSNKGNKVKTPQFFDPMDMITMNHTQPTTQPVTIAIPQKAKMNGSFIFARAQILRWMFGKSVQTLTPQKWEPSVQMGVEIPARR